MVWRVLKVANVADGLKIGRRFANILHVNPGQPTRDGLPAKGIFEGLRTLKFKNPAYYFIEHRA